MNLPRRPLVAASALVTAALLGVTACSPAAQDTPATTASSSSSSTASQSAAHFPASATSCDETITFEKAPERVLMLSDVDAPILHRLGLLDRVVARAGNVRVDESAPDLLAALDKIPTLESSDTGTGGAKLSTEAILAQKPDLVLGYDEGADRAALKAAGVPLYSPASFCPEFDVTQADFDLVKQEVDIVATIFGVPAKAAELNAELDKELAEIPQATADKGTAVVLFVMPGSQTFYTYGTSSMVQPILEANGLKNLYDDNTQRVFDASMEDVLRRNPDYIVLLADDPDPASARAAFDALPGSQNLKATIDNHVVFLPFILTDPPTTLSIRGAVELQKRLDEVK